MTTETKLEEVKPDVVGAIVGPIESKVPAPVETVAQLVEAEDEDEIFVAARTPQEMGVAQQRLIGWAHKKAQKMLVERDEAKRNFDIAIKRKWNSKPFQRLVAQAQKKFEFYQKVEAALKAGYTIIPDMPMDVFAVRTTKKKPARNERTAGGTGPRIDSQVTNNPPLNEGRFVHPRAFEEDYRYEALARDGTTKLPMVKRWAVEFDEHIDFPFKMARPSVLNATAQALAEKIFDEVGAAPARHVAVKGDPMVIGRIVYRNGWHQKGISFLVTWFINSKDL